MSERPQHYTAPAIALHWLVGLGLIGMFCFGLYMTSLELSPLKLKYYSWHKWAGMCLWVLIFVRIFWRATHPAPAQAADMPRWQVIVAESLHGLLYVLMVCIPLSGWLYTSAAGYPVVMFGVLQLPDLVGKDAELALVLKGLHGLFNYTLAAMVGLHVAAALKHHLIDHDAVLGRMVPWLRKS